MTEMSTKKLVSECQHRGICLFARDDGNLSIDAPQGALTPEILGQLRIHKLDIIRVLRLRTRQVVEREAPLICFMGDVVWSKSKRSTRPTRAQPAVRLNYGKPSWVLGVASAAIHLRSPTHCVSWRRGSVNAKTCGFDENKETRQRPELPYESLGCYLLSQQATR